MSTVYDHAEEADALASAGTSSAVTVAPVWVANVHILWDNRRILIRTGAISLLLALAIAFALPKRYQSSARIMPPSNSVGGAAMLATLAGHGGSGLSSLGALAGGLLGGGGNTALFTDLLRSGTIAGHMIDRFDLQHVYHARYRVDAGKALARHTVIVDDKKSGIITITVTDSEPIRARDLAQGYLEELNTLVNHTSTSSAHQERLFIEKRLRGVQRDLATAQEKLSDFSSEHETVDIKEQTRAMVDAAARLQSQLVIEQAGLDSLRQTYGDGNVRVHAIQARIAYLQGQVAKMSGSSAPLAADDKADRSSRDNKSHDLTKESSYPPLRQLPRLAVPYADLYREVRVQETVYELLTQQFEMARIQEAKDVPIVSVIDAPGIPEKKSFPPRLLLSLILTIISLAITAVWLLARDRWQMISSQDPLKMLVARITGKSDSLNPGISHSKTQ